MVSIRRIICLVVSLALAVIIIQAASLWYHSRAVDNHDHNGSVADFLGFGDKKPPSASGVCAKYQDLGLYTQAEIDFARYKDGLDTKQQEQYKSFCKTVLKHSCLTVIILRGRIFIRHFYPGYQSRHRSTVYALYKVMQRFGPLPDAQFVIEVTDGYLQGGFDLPIFMITRPAKAQVGVLYPDFTFYSWPEAVCPPERSHAYGYLFSLYEREARKAAQHPEDFWAAKEDVLFWRGGHVHNQNRDAAVRAFVDKPAVDLQFMVWHNTSITGVNGAPGCVGLLEHCKYKYLASLDGNTYTSRLKYNYLCGSCVFQSQQPYVEWWTRHFKPDEDYIEVKSDWSDAPQKHSQVRWSSDGGRKVAESAREKALELLNEDAVDCYWLKLIELAAATLPKPAQVEFEDLPASTKPIEDVIHYANDFVIDDDGLVGPVVIVR